MKVLRKLFILTVTMVLATGCGKTSVDKDSISNLFKSNIETPIIMNAKGDVLLLSVPDCGNTVLETDLSKYIVCNCQVEEDEDPNYSVKIMDYVSNIELSKQTDIRKAKVMDRSTLVGEDAFARVIGDNIIYVTSKDELLLERLQESVLGAAVTGSNTYNTEKLKTLKELPKADSKYNEELKIIIPIGGIDSVTTKYEDGVVVGQSRLSSFGEASKAYIGILNTLTKGSIETTYSRGNETQGLVYATGGNYTVAIESENLNTQLVYLGIGEAARQNILLELN